ncbi:unnamed protein product [Effrenium voratum]|nr:unnamed protein product [Effrenium voratum]
MARRQVNSGDTELHTSKPPTRAREAEVLRAGRRVLIHGLARQAELNGRFGQLVRLDSSVDPPRWLVRMKGEKEVVYRLLPERLRLAPLPKKRPAAKESEDVDPSDPLELPAIDGA